MASPTKSPISSLVDQSWTLPIAATILVAGSLVFWTCLGLFWLAIRQSPSRPIVIWMPPAADGNAAQTFSFPSTPYDVAQDR